MEATSPQSSSLDEENSASLFSQMLVSWLSPLLSIGYRRPLDASDLPNLRPALNSKRLHKNLAASWETRRTLDNRYSLILASMNAFGGPFYWAGVLKLIGDICALSSPVALSLIIKDLKNDVRQDLYYGLGLCLLIFVFQMVNTITVNSYFNITMQTGLKIRTSVSALVYEKSLKLSSKARQSFSTGQIVNLMSTDAGRLDTAVSYVHYIWSGPFQILVIIAMLFRLLNWAAFAGIGFLIVFIPIQGRVTSKLSRFRKQTIVITDQRVRLMQEIIQGIRVVKFYAWENSFLEKLFTLRNDEICRVKKAQTIRSLTIVITSMTAILSCIVTFISYYMMGNELTAEIVFPTLALFNLLRTPLMLLPMVISFAVDASVAAKRIRKFLLAEELDFVPTVDESSPFGVEIQDGTFIWETTEKKDEEPKNVIVATSTSQLLTNDNDAKDEDSFNYALEDIDLKVKRGDLVAIVGTVGSGKSTLLNSLVGELKALKGRVIFGGTVAYCPQQAWIQNATVRDNILFGRSYDDEKYFKVIHACALGQDFAALPDGDQTEIGEKGVNLSGGQKQRISLARAAYSDVDIVLLDDPLSAVDAHVGKHLMKHCINGIMAGKTRVLVTHQLNFVHSADYVVLMSKGRIVEQGPVSDLVQNNGTVSELLRAHAPSTVPTPMDQPELLTLSVQSASLAPSVLLAVTPTRADLPPVLVESPAPSVLKNGGKLTTAEERVVGAVEWAIYREYIIAAGGRIFIITAISSVVLWNITRVLTDYWIALWTSKDPIIAVTPHLFIMIYLGLGLLQVLWAVISSISISFGGIRAAKALHNNSAQRVLHAPVSFFDTNPTGRIINRFSKDVDAIDNLIPETLRSFIHTMGLTLFTFFAMIILNWRFIFPLLVLLWLYYFVQAYYRHSGRELKRIEALSRSPLYSHFSETLTGLSTIRAFGQSDRFMERNLALLNTNNKASYAQLSIQRWLGIRLETIGNFIILSASASCYIFDVIPSITGLTISYSLGITGTMNWCIRQFADTETQIISSERLGYYANQLPVEGKHPSGGAPENWPEKGHIEFDNISMKYRPDLPNVLEKITLSIEHGQRIGIVGRTGAGKSSIMLALFRIVEPSEGTIKIDGTDTSTLNLTDLRSNLSIIPQDPVVFAGTVRWNLDPSSHHSDNDMWNALEKAHLRDTIHLMGGLDALLQDGGENLSVGQRQLLCLARAILQKNQIIVLDEATANIDMATDALIQESIRTDFPGCTILTIAHRISTVIDYDKILVLEKGRVIEFDSPANLLQKEDSTFASLVRESHSNSNT